MTIKNSTELENNNNRKDNKMTEKKEDREMTELQKVDAKDMWKKIYKENITLFKIFPKLKQGLLPNEKPVHGWQYKEKDIANWNIYTRYLLTSIYPTNFDNFINFMRQNNELCYRIAKKVESIGGFKEKNSYIIISKNNEILNNMMIWIFLSIIKSETEYPSWFYTTIGYETFEFNEIVQLLNRKPYQFNNYDDEDDKLESDNMHRNVYFDVINHDVGYLYEESEEIKVYGKVNNRMLSLMHRGRYGTIILSKTPINIFEKQIENGVDSFHILDLRDIENNTEETVEME